MNSYLLRLNFRVQCEIPVGTLEKQLTVCNSSGCFYSFLVHSGRIEGIEIHVDKEDSRITPASASQLYNNMSITVFSGIAL